MNNRRRGVPIVAALLSLVSCAACCTAGSDAPSQPLKLASSDPRDEPNGWLLNPRWEGVAKPETLNAGRCNGTCGAIEVSEPPDWTKVLPFICKDTGGGERKGKAAGHLL